MQINSKTFCVAPWFHLHTNNLSQFAACCQIDHSKSNFVGKKNYNWPEDNINSWLNSPYMTYLRQELTQGNKLPECSKCWQKESYGERSMRNRANAIEEQWTKLYFIKKENFTQDLLTQSEIKLTNVCNFSCAMCVPADSSKIYTAWQQDLNGEWVTLQLTDRPNYLNNVRDAFLSKNNHSLLQEVIARQPKNISLLGGEPLLDKVALNLLKNINEKQKQKTNLSFMTNGSVNLNQTVEELGNFKNIKFDVSLEGIGDIQDWVRKGSDWLSIKENIESYINQHSTAHISIHYTAQALTVFQLDKLLSWCADKQIDFKFTKVGDVRGLSLEALPDAIKQSTYDLLSKLKLTVANVSSNTMLQETTPQNLANLILNTTYRSECFEDLKKFFAWYDPDGNWKKIIPEWLPYID
jgi:molybdenum cofactor biosynthesis enzyme MoaA